MTSVEGIGDGSSIMHGERIWEVRQDQIRIRI